MIAPKEDTLKADVRGRIFMLRAKALKMHNL